LRRGARTVYVGSWGHLLKNGLEMFFPMDESEEKTRGSILILVDHVFWNLSKHYG
jgi:hypothetical protein